VPQLIVSIIQTLQVQMHALSSIHSAYQKRTRIIQKPRRILSYTYGISRSRLFSGINESEYFSVKPGPHRGKKKK
jgi:hypothetical protein